MKTATQSAPLITDEQSLVSATSRFGSAIPTYDDGFGSLFIHRDSMGVSGIVRAQSWEDAYSICEDEFFPEASETFTELVREYGRTREHVKIIRDAAGAERDAVLSDYPFDKTGCVFVRWETREHYDETWTTGEAAEAMTNSELFQEAFGFRPNGPNDSDTLKHGIYSKDLNGDALDLLTPELLEALEITLEIVEA